MFSNSILGSQKRSEMSEWSYKNVKCNYHKTRPQLKVVQWFKLRGNIGFYTINMELNPWGKETLCSCYNNLYGDDRLWGPFRGNEGPRRGTEIWYPWCSFQKTESFLSLSNLNDPVAAMNSKVWLTWSCLMAPPLTVCGAETWSHSGKGETHE